ncbi:hypothetical protein HZU73_07837 [Apis mellifera caucasica]|nr:hypothetical protein HZU73_07837 [Apis mellifera caucasica]KAG9430538.1 hypothetical protein HZU67_07741 [Apis mellifera carnica]
MPECFGKKEVKEDVSKPLSQNRPTCYDQFAIAKKLHAENLEHQPLPDKVDDSVFKNVRLKESSDKVLSKKYCDYCKQEFKNHCTNANKHYRPVLGCKEPKTKMDLAICWETPINPIYETPKPTHIDGSEGGVAPAIFTLVQHSSTSKASVHSETVKNEKSSTSYQDQCKLQDSNYCYKNKEENSKNVKCYDCTCKDSNILKKNKIEEQPKKETFRKCIACNMKNIDPRLIRSAVGLTLGTENNQKDESKLTIPRPKTSLVPPFNIVNRYRDGEFPEHWRLMSVYQQSYKNPYRRKIYHS